MSVKKKALNSIDAEQISDSGKIALKNLEGEQKLEQETIIQTNLQKLLINNQRLKQLNLEEEQLLKADKDKLRSLNSKQRKRLTISLPNERKTLIKNQRVKATKLSAFQLFKLNQNYEKKKQQLFLKDRQEQKNQKSTFQTYLQKLLGDTN